MPSMVILIENISEEQMTEMVIANNGLRPTPQRPWKFWVYPSASLHDCIPAACARAQREDEGFKTQCCSNYEEYVKKHERPR